MRARRRWRYWFWIVAAGAVVGTATMAIVDALPDAEEQARAQLEIQLAERVEAILPRAEAGEPSAQYAVAEHYLKGLGVKRDPALALAWFRKAAERSHIGAQFAVGSILEAGDGVRPDYRAAVGWYELAASLGDHPGAEFALARLYYYGRGVPSDPAETLRWVERAANRGHPAAQALLGRILATGWGVAPDLAGAYRWYLLASRKSREVGEGELDFDPIAERDAVAARLTRFDREKAEQWARTWRPAADRGRHIPEGTSLVGLGPRPQPRKTAPTRQAIRLLVMNAPLVDSRSETVKVSLLVELENPDLQATLCALVPRAREAVFLELQSRPVPRSGGRPDLGSVHHRLLDPINRAVAPAVARSTFLYLGDRRLDSHDVRQTPFDVVTDCPRGVASAMP